MVESVESINVVGNNIEQSAIFIRSDLLLHPYGTPHQSYHVLKLVVSVELELLVDDVAFDEVLLENGGCPTTKRCCILAIYSISYGNNHIKIVIWYFSNYLSLSLYSNLCIFCTS